MAYSELKEKQKRLAELLNEPSWTELSAIATAERALTLLIALAEIENAENKEKEQ